MSGGGGNLGGADQRGNLGDLPAGTTQFFFAAVTSDDAKVLIISVAARMAGMHPQTLRQYDRMGLVQPGRASGGGRRYSVRDVALLREIQRLSQDDGVNLAGVKRVIELEQLTHELQLRLARVEEELAVTRQRLAQLEAMGLPRRDLVPHRQTPTALVVWTPRRNP
jgi:MerR family transcriptional regulator/heat shock protein HspR